jgi:hypothetical protein
VSLAIKYETAEDATMRLRNTVVLYKGNPVSIREIIPGTKDEIFRVLFRELPIVGDKEEIAERKYISSKHFDIAPFKLGYVNRPTGSGAFYCSRLPNRIQKQGLCGENFSAVAYTGEHLPFNVFLKTKETLDMIAGRYPSYAVALRALAKVPAVAFSRDFCFVKDEVVPELVYIYHKGAKVGLWKGETSSVVVGKKFECLKEGLSELGIRVTVV